MIFFEFKEFGALFTLPLTVTMSSPPGRLTLAPLAPPWTKVQ
ncbi:MAG TPA: hypothetical protein VGU22_16410 [Methylomirabilota bacterium]|nr:hypothetical protein [Methylomirabilota bacterium]